VTGRDFLAYFTVAVFMCSCAGQAEPPARVQAPAPVVKTVGSCEPTDYYVLGEGDTIDLQVWRQDTLKRSLKVDMQGNVTIPLVGTIRVAGLTIREAHEEITKRLGKYYVEPQVDIFVSASKSQTVHVYGEVSNPGSVSLDHRTTAWEVIAKAAFTKNSDKSKVVLIRNAIPNGEAANVKVSALNLDPAQLQHESIVADCYVQNGDIIYVPPTKISNIDVFMSHLGAVIAPVLGVTTGIVILPQVIDIIKGESASSSSSQGIIVGH